MTMVVQVRELRSLKRKNSSCVRIKKQFLMGYRTKQHLFSRLAPLFCLLFAILAAETEENSAAFIFLVDPKLKPSAFSSHFHWYSSLVSSPSRLLHQYRSLLHGFCAALTASEALAIRSSWGVVASFPDYLLRPHTTRSPTFLGLDLPRSRLSAFSHGGSDAVIGVIDTGIWPEHPSFSDSGLGPPPIRWRGHCEVAPGFNRSCCNRKLVGAYAFWAGYAAAFGVGAIHSPRDLDGHGTHVASIAAGAPVAGAGFEGFAGGIARGVAPRARIAVYKVCWAAGCMVSDVIAAMERAVDDGVDVLSLSIGSSSPAPLYHLDPLAVATFRATMRGVFVAASAGNGGPAPGTVANSPPWITTIGASTIDRDFPAIVLLGNGKCIRGTSISIPPQQPVRLHPMALISAGNITADVNLISNRINGRIVLWESSRAAKRIEIGAALKRAGAVMTVVFHGDQDPEGILAEPHVVPTVAVGSRGVGVIEAYLSRASNPTAVIYSEGTVVIPDGIAPVVASFSARGPNPAVPWVLKPDLVAPGVDILGAWTDAIGPSGLPGDTRQLGFSMMSGTSMACPHVSGVAALIRAARPGWGPGKIRSALMTSSSATGDETGVGGGGPLAAGAGHLWPERAAAPGLVYDLGYEDYMALLCRLNYTERAVRIITGNEVIRCDASTSAAGIWGFNYPSFVATAEEVALRGELVFHRKLELADVAGADRWYKAEAAAPEGYTAVVEPERVRFGRTTVEFRLVLKRINGDGRRSAYGSGSSSGKRRERRGNGSLTWREEAGKHRVRSPIVVL